MSFYTDQYFLISVKEENNKNKREFLKRGLLSRKWGGTPEAVGWNSSQTQMREKTHVLVLLKTAETMEMT